MIEVTAILASPNPAGRSAGAAEVVLSSARESGAEVHSCTPADGEAAHILLDRADAILIAAPTYRESYPGALKSFLDALPRGVGSDATAPLAGKPVGIVLTGASAHHYLALNALHGLLSGGFAALVVPLSIYAHHGQIQGDGQITDDRLHVRLVELGEELVELARLLAARPGLRDLRPQI